MREVGWEEAERYVFDGGLALGGWGLIAALTGESKVYHDVLSALEDDLLAGMVSPPLMGSCGVLPLTVISTYLLIIAMALCHILHGSSLICASEQPSRYRSPHG
jgi:hypothetical protein